MRKSFILFLLLLTVITMSAQIPIPAPGSKPSTSTPSPKPKQSRPRKTYTPQEQKAIIDRLVSNMVHVEGGTFTMGATREQGTEADNNEKPAHKVTLSSFYIGRYEVTQEEWQAVMGYNSSEFEGDKLPINAVSWKECQTFIRKLNSLTGLKFRLPTEAEWEYAARGGKRSKGYKYSGGNNLDNVAWYRNNSGGKPHPVGQKLPNELGLYDMTGNVSEWCMDWLGNYSSSPQTNPQGESSDWRRAYRGGYWDDGPKSSRVSWRDFDATEYDDEDYGFRLAR